MPTEDRHGNRIGRLIDDNPAFKKPTKVQNIRREEDLKAENLRLRRLNRRLRRQRNELRKKLDRR